MAKLSLCPRPSTIEQLLRNTRRQGRTCIPDLASRSRAAAGDPLETLGVLHSIKRVVMVAAPLLMMTLKTTELSIGREGALTKSQMITV
jgi:hypothetical protein